MSSSSPSKLESRFGIHQRPLKEQLAVVIYRIRTQRNKIESMSLMMQRRDKEFFDKCVTARAAGDAQRANLLAEECAEVRNLAKIAINSELALEQLIFKLKTAEMMGDISYLVDPVRNVVATVGQQIQRMMPDVSFELGQINESLETIMVDTGSITDNTSPIATPSSEADKIMHEADTLAEQKIKSRFPEIRQAQPVAESTG